MLKIKSLIRSITVSIMFAVFGFGALFVRYLMMPFNKTQKENYRTLQKSWKFFIWLLKKTRVIKFICKDLEKIEGIKNSIIVSTHPSFIDIIILMSLIPYSTCFVAERLANNPMLKGMVKLLFIIEGQQIDVWLEEACTRLNEGLNVIIFPMGIRHRRNEYPKIRRGASMIAQRSGKNIVMLDLNTSFDFLQIHQPFYDAGSEEVVFTLDYLGEINTKEYSESFPDEVSFRTEVTKEISKILYKK